MNYFTTPVLNLNTISVGPFIKIITYHMEAHYLDSHLILLFLLMKTYLLFFAGVLLVCLQVVLKAVASPGEVNICTVCRCSTQEDEITGIPQSLIDCSFMDFGTVLENVNLPIFSLSLNLNHNNLSIISKELFSEWNPLKMLSISYNNLREISERAFDNFNNLNSLDLSHNKLTVLPEHLFDVQVMYIIFTEENL